MLSSQPNDLLIILMTMICPLIGLWEVWNSTSLNLDTMRLTIVLGFKISQWLHAKGLLMMSVGKDFYA